MKDKKSKVHASWNSLSSGYRKNFPESLDAEMAIMKEYLAGYLPEDAGPVRVLDVGTGHIRGE